MDHRKRNIVRSIVIVISIINRKGKLNHRTVGIAHEFGYVLSYLRGLPFGHSQRGVDSFVYKKNDDMMKRLGYGK